MTVPYFPQIIQQSTLLGRMTQNRGPVEEIPWTSLAGTALPALLGMPFETRAAAIATSIPAVITTIQTRYRSTVGDSGGAIYVRGSTPVADFTDAAGNSWKLATTQEIRVEMFGAVGNAMGTWNNLNNFSSTATDDRAAIQSAIDWCLRNGVVELHFTPGKAYRITGTLHCGYDAFNSIWLIGRKYKQGYYASAGFSPVEIYCDFYNAPGVNFQAQRFGGMRGITLVGKNFEYVGTKTFTNYDLSSDASTWLDPAITPAGSNPGGLQVTAPYAGITIDAYAGSTPAIPYPTVSYPSWTGIASQYSKRVSSEVKIEDCNIVGFAVGICTHPNSPLQGDFFKFRDLQISHCVYGIAVCGHQSRNVDCAHLNYLAVHSAVTNLHFGVATGMWGGTIRNPTGGWAYQFCDFGAGGYNDTLIIENFYAEVQVRFGNVGNANNPQPVIIRGGTFSGVTTQIVNEIPTVYIEAAVGQPVTLEGCNIMPHRRLTNLVSFGANVKVDGNRWLGGSADMVGTTFGNSAFQKALNYTGGWLAASSNYDSAGNAHKVEYIGDTIAGYMPTATTAALQSSWLSKQVKFVAAGASLNRVQVRQSSEYIVDSNNRKWEFFQPTGFVNASTAVVAPSYASDVVSFSWPATSQRFQRTRFAPGDIVLVQNTQTVFVVKTVAVGSGGRADVTMQQMNNMKVNRTTGAMTDNLNSDLTLAGNWHVWHVNFTVPSQMHFGRFTSGSAVVTEIDRGDGLASDLASYFAANDYLSGPGKANISTWPVQGQAFATASDTPVLVSSLDATARTLTMNHVATESGIFPLFPLEIANYTGYNVRDRLTANRTYYVRTDGSDSNTGLADTSGGAFWTIQKAIDTVASIDVGTQAVTIQLGDGTHTGAISVKGPWLGTGTVTLRGNSSTPANVVVKSTSGDLLTLSNGARLTASYLEFQTATGAYACVVSTSGSQFLFGPGLRFGACSYAHMQAYNGGTIYGRQAYSIVGSATIHIQVVDFGGVDISGVDLTLVGTPAFTQYAYASRGGMLTHYLVNVVSGSATGQRYDVSYNSVIFTLGGTLPGSTAGAAATGGVYG